MDDNFLEISSSSILVFEPRKDSNIIIGVPHHAQPEWLNCRVLSTEKPMKTQDLLADTLRKLSSQHP